MSSSQQDKSIPQQRAEMLPRCKLEGVQVVAEFKDEGISGGGMARRDAFLKMLAYCQERHQAGHPVAAVVCYDTSRFSRADSNETAAYIWQFRQAGVCRLLTVERWYNFARPEDRTMFNIGQDFGNHRFLVEHSRKVLRGKKAAAEAGCFCGGMVPYAFDRLLLDENGVPVQRIPRGAKVRVRNDDWSEVLAPFPADDPDPDRQQERQTVLWLYQTFATQNVSFRSLAEILNKKGIPGPGSPYRWAGARRGRSPWNPQAVKFILTNEVYRGLAHVGKIGTGTYHRLIDAQVTAVGPGDQRTGDGTGIVRELPFGGLVDPALWESVQGKVRERARKSFLARRGGYALPGGVLHCGHCGGRMHGATVKPRRNGKMWVYRTYVCSSRSTSPGVCRSYSVREQTILDALVSKLQEVYLAPERLEGLRDKLKARAEARHEKAPGRAEGLKKRLAELDRDIKQGALNLLRSPDNVDVLNEVLSDLRDQRERAAKELAALERVRDVPAEDAAAKVDQAVRRLYALKERLGEAVAGGQGEEFRRRLGEVIRLLVSRVDVYFTPEAKAKRTFYRFARGVIRMRPLLEVQGSDKNDLSCLYCSATGQGHNAE
jgi:DNA invertase Pin-like site-specific DNA recombinase